MTVFKSLIKTKICDSLDDIVRTLFMIYADFKSYEE